MRVAPRAFHAPLRRGSSVSERTLHRRAAALPRRLVQIAVHAHVRLGVAPCAFERTFVPQHVGADDFVLLFVQRELARSDLVHELQELAVLPLRVRVLAHRARHFARRVHRLLLPRAVERDLLARSRLDRLCVVGCVVLLVMQRRRFRLFPRELLVRLASRLPRVVHVQRLEVIDPRLLRALVHELLWRRRCVAVHRAIEVRRALRVFERCFERRVVRSHHHRTRLHRTCRLLHLAGAERRLHAAAVHRLLLKALEHLRVGAVCKVLSLHLHLHVVHVAQLLWARGVATAALCGSTARLEDAVHCARERVLRRDRAVDGAPGALHHLAQEVHRCAQVCECVCVCGMSSRGRAEPKRMRECQEDGGGASRRAGRALDVLAAGERGRANSALFLFVVEKKLR